MDFAELRYEVQDLNQQAAMLIKAGNLDAAKVKLDKAIDLEPMFVDNYRNYGDLYMAAEEYKSAKDSYRKALLVEKQGILYFLYGNACFMNDEIHEGMEYYNMAINAGYDSEEMMFFMGMAYENLNDDNMALRFFQKACAKNPSRPDFLIKKIASLVRLDMLESAEDEIDHLLRIAPEMYDGYHMKTQLLMHKGDVENATKFAKSAVDRFPADADLMFDYAHCIARSGEREQAMQLIKTAKQMRYFEGSKRSFLILEAQIAAEMNDFDLACACCEECIATEDDEFFAGEARFYLMNFSMVQKNLEKALAQAERLIQKKEQDHFYNAALYYKAFCLKEMKREEEARKAYKDAVVLYRLITLKDPGAIDVYLYRAMCLKDLEEYDKALEMLDFILGLNTEIAEVHLLKAEIYKTLGRNAQSDEQLQKAYALKPELRPETSEAGE